MIDVSPLVPDARRAALTAAEIYVEHTRPWLIGLIAMGSALKGGYIPGCSDIDLHLFLADSAFEPDGCLPLELGIAIHRDLAKIDPAPFQYIQCHARKSRLSGEDELSSIGEIPGTYHVLLGEVPVPDATPEQVRDRAARHLASLLPGPIDIAGNLLEHGGGRFERDVRLLVTKVWPVMYEVLTLQAPNPLEPWSLPKDEAIALLSQNADLGGLIQRFYQTVQEYYADGQSVEVGLGVNREGVEFLQAAKAWYDNGTH